MIVVFCLSISGCMSGAMVGVIAAAGGVVGAKFFMPGSEPVKFEVHHTVGCGSCSCPPRR